MKIKINEDDNDKYFVVALIVDNPAVLKSINLIRERLGLVDQLIPYEEFNNYVKFKLDYELDPTEIDYYSDLIEKEKRADEGLDIVSAKKLVDIRHEIGLWQNPAHNFFLRIDNLLDLAHLGTEFRDILAKAIVCGEVYGSDLPRDYARHFVKNIKRDRELFWDNSNGLGYRKLAKKYDMPIETIKSAIDAYKNRISIGL